jgi:hypothetical protein
MTRATYPEEVDMAQTAWPNRPTTTDPSGAPTALELGALVGVEMLRMAWMAHHMGVEFDVLADWDDEVCPAWPTPPTIPPHVWPFEIDVVDDTWVLEYHRGLAATLAVARGQMRSAPIIVEAHDKARRAIQAAAD